MAVWIAVAACRSTPPPPPPLASPPVELGIRHWAGTVLTGRRAGERADRAIDPADVVAVEVDVSYVAGLADDVLEPLASHARLVVGSRGGNPLLPVADLSIGGRVGSGETVGRFLDEIEPVRSDASRFVRLGKFRGVLPPGVSVAVSAESRELLVTEEGRATRRRAAVLVSREGEGSYSVAFLLDDLTPDTSSGEDVDPRNIVFRQIVLLEDEPEPGGDPVALVFPSRYDPEARRAFLVEVRIGAVPDDPDEAASLVAACAEDLRLEAAEAQASRRVVDPSEADRRSLAAALDALDVSRHQRAGLVYLADSSDAPLALDLALSADEATLAAWVQSLGLETDGTRIDSLGDEAIGWLLERTAYRLLADRLDADDLTGDLHALLVLHAGEAGRFPGVLASVLSRDAGRDEFEAAIVAENLEFLTASDPSARVRAFDWLDARSLAPEGYDPLALREERRAALERAANPGGSTVAGEEGR